MFSQSLSKPEVVEELREFRNVSTRLSGMRVLSPDLSRSVVEELDIMNTWRAMTSVTMGSLDEFNNLWQSVFFDFGKAGAPRLISED
jgi:hypothetical protein